jgi:arsenite methyltransferase
VQRSHPKYGVDAPWITFGFLIGGLALCSIEFVQHVVQGLIWPGLSFGLTGATMLWGSLVGKKRLRDRVFAAIDDQPRDVLDIGCGRGLLLIGAAKRFPGARAVGIDRWRSLDQSFNSSAATLENARLEGVSDRVTLVDGDARALPFSDASFDLVVSSFAIHNIPDAPGREKAILEAMRVLRPGGRLEIVDIFAYRQYERILRAAGWETSTVKAAGMFVVTAYWIRAKRP